jgi:V/A-type H+-transporting ATPase subunit E
MTAEENVIKKVINEAKEEIKTVLDEGLNNSIESLEKAKIDTNLEVENIISSKEKQADMIERRILGSAELESRNKSLEVVEESINEVFIEASKKLKESVKTDDYKKALKNFLEEGLDAVGSDNLVVFSNKKDSTLLNAIIKEIVGKRNVKISLSKETIDCIGGIQLKTPDGSVFYDNTIEARLERLRPLLRKDIASLFVGKK